jgi:hypothetical protein
MQTANPTDREDWGVRRINRLPGLRNRSVSLQDDQSGSGSRLASFESSENDCSFRSPDHRRRATRSSRPHVNKADGRYAAASYYTEVTKAFTAKLDIRNVLLPHIGYCSSDIRNTFVFGSCNGSQSFPLSESN